MNVMTIVAFDIETNFKDTQVCEYQPVLVSHFYRPACYGKIHTMRIEWKPKQ